MEYPEEKVKGSVDRGSRDCPEGDSDEARSCGGCGTTKTPLWRCGPLGPKVFSLCNACGIRYKKRGRSNMGLKGGGVGKERRDGVSLKGLGFGVVKQRWGLIQKQKLGEEEQAAVLLMALSSGFLCSPNHYFSQS